MTSKFSTVALESPTKQPIFVRWRMRRKVHHMKRNVAATILQKHFRRFRDERAYLKQKESAIKIQAWIRMCLARKSYQSVLDVRTNSAVKIQSFVRMMLQRKTFHKIKNAALVLQTHMRRHLAQKKLQTLKIARQHQLENAAVTIQAQVRGYLARKLVRQMETETRAAILIQKNWRMFLVRKRYVFDKEQVIKIQSWVRMIQAQKRYRLMLHRRHQAALSIQCHFKMFKVYL